MQTAFFTVEGMTCDGCSSGLQKALSALDGVVSATVDRAAARASVDYDPGRVSPSSLRAAIEDAGFDVPA
ncbi:cation/copper resistance transporter ATPase CopZ [Ameyamaea chiangmaiensis NBRC 103196]|uniref:Heavy-metal-associated domain-containing protein n=1 Tax=Ameyamaea chiangmaiensis TaxID=442969 RepID=A0A850PDY0_9PROT|nr:heavy metal-associated domain-containing protein [Ameyamaea chiangmaiensis]MBS4075118.1 heavy-metal-associated domain-containing protein [Ameyamaea chiangmaiensis]NVN40680.1 heavy-metal-associated domain-containing protein [Ameyamaea chiangmaiensis]GBQ66122.1 cation/copper resistance transporter ATPase CopZ [Ameyamaea chiangmaiensis NBRC 103196]